MFKPRVANILFNDGGGSHVVTLEVKCDNRASQIADFNVLISIIYDGVMTPNDIRDKALEVWQSNCHQS